MKRKEIKMKNLFNLHKIKRKKKKLFTIIPRYFFLIFWANIWRKNFEMERKLCMCAFHAKFWLYLFIPIERDFDVSFFVRFKVASLMLFVLWISELSFRLFANQTTVWSFLLGFSIVCFQGVKILTFHQDQIEIFKKSETD